MASELESYQQVIDDLREEVCELIAGLPAEALNWRPLEGVEEHATNSLAVLAAHVAVWEHFWMGEVVGGRLPTLDRGAEFVMQVQDASTLVQLLEASGAETRAVLGDLTASELEGVRQVRDKTVAVRWCILHVIDHTALHIGHMQLTYQLWQGGQSGHSAH
jgi:uncharacterized damage-inducible protein DinB